MLNIINIIIHIKQYVTNVLIISDPFTLNVLQYEEMNSNKERHQVCSMIMSSENAAPLYFLQGNESLVQLWEAKVLGFSFLKQ